MDTCGGALAWQGDPGGRSKEQGARSDSGFGPFDFVGGNFRRLVLILVRATEKNKTFLNQKIPQKIIEAVNVD